MEEDEIHRVARQLTELLPAFRASLKDQLGPDTRQAQNLTILTSITGIALIFGWVSIEKLSLAVGELKTSNVSNVVASILLFAASTFFYAGSWCFSRETRSFLT
jgi:hypothetical protein